MKTLRYSAINFAKLCGKNFNSKGTLRYPQRNAKKTLRYSAINFAKLCGKFNGAAKERNENSVLLCDQLCETLQ